MRQLAIAAALWLGLALSLSACAPPEGFMSVPQNATDTQPETGGGSGGGGGMGY